MKHILLVRHAKSSWDDPSLSDFDRPLNERGKKDAPSMAKKLKNRKIKVDAFVTSPAKRAKQTSKHFANEFDFKKKNIVPEPKLYEAGEENFYEVIENLKNKWDSVVIVSHNPGITSFANSLTEIKIDDMPTSSIFAIKIDTEKWANFRTAKKTFWFFDYPKIEAN
ncbi:MAG TPA: histidine phosphatase family protein [Chitinophagaceae bacterium]|jgi:phosphohistidine phosphatase|nr:histidine phosphatase family protein [Chitinophagaceae bacterium]